MHCSKHGAGRSMDGLEQDAPATGRVGAAGPPSSSLSNARISLHRRELDPDFS